MSCKNQKGHCPNIGRPTDKSAARIEDLGQNCFVVCVNDKFPRTIKHVAGSYAAAARYIGQVLQLPLAV